MDTSIQRNTPVDHLPLFLTTNEAAILLGCSTALVRELCSSGQLLCKKVGRAFKIYRGDLLDFFTKPQIDTSHSNHKSKIA